MLLAELERALSYPKLRKRIAGAEAQELLDWLRRSAMVVDDPSHEPPIRSPDPGDDYLLGLAAAQRAPLVSGDQHLLSLRAESSPIHSPADFLALIESSSK